MEPTINSAPFSQPEASEPGLRVLLPIFPISLGILLSLLLWDLAPVCLGSAGFFFLLLTLAPKRDLIFFTLAALGVGELVAGLALLSGDLISVVGPLAIPFFFLAAVLIFAQLQSERHAKPCSAAQ